MTILKLGESALRKMSVDIDKNNFDKKIVKELFNTCNKYGGIGLAAPQVGINERIFVLNHSMKKVFINPQLTPVGFDKIVENEKCLSLDDNYKVSRYKRIRIQYYDENWKYYDEIYSDYTARIIQHEYDHLDGILIIDRKI